MNKILIALITGFVAGILFAPEKGTVTRKKIADGFDGLSEKLADLSEKLAPEENKWSDEAPSLPKMTSAI